MSICDNYEKTIGTLTLETSVYEDGYVQVSLIDEFGEELDSDGENSVDDDTAEVRARIEEALIYKHFDN